MKTQQDNQVRMVALANIEAMCERQSGMCHRYWIERVTANRVTIGYSNPDEYGRESPIFAVYPAFASVWPGDEDNPRVVLRLALGSDLAPIGCSPQQTKRGKPTC